MRLPWLVLPLVPALIVTTAQAQPSNRKAIANRLSHIAAFAIVSEDGRFTVFKPQGENKDIIPFFLERKELEQLLENRKDIFGSSRIRETNLGRVYELILDLRGKKGSNVDIAVQPSQTQVNHALRILRSQGKNLNRFPGIPVFMFVRKSDNNVLEVVVKDGRREVSYSPVFLSYEDAEGFRQNLRKIGASEAEAAKIGIRVTSLDVMVKLMEEKDGESIYLVPMGGLGDFLRLINIGDK